MALYLNDPDATGLAAGTAVTTSNSGGSTGGTANTAFSTVTNGPTIDTVLPPANQSKVYNFSAAVSSAVAALVQCSITSTTTASGGTFLTLTGYPSAAQQVLRLGGTGTNYIGLTTAGKLYCVWNSATQFTSSVTLSLNKRYWISTGMTIVTSNATFTFELYDGTTGALLDKYTTTAANTGSTAVATFAAGKISTGGTMPTFYLSGFRAADNTPAGINMPSYPASGTGPKPVATYTYEEGSTGVAVASATAPGCLATSGSSVYLAAAAQHGALGVKLSAAAYLQYATPNASDGQVSIYGQLLAIPTSGSAQLLGFGSSLANASNPGASTGARVLVNLSGAILVQAGVNLVSTGVTLPLNTPFRVDFQYDDTSSALGIAAATSATVMVYVGANVEGTTPNGSATSNGSTGFGSGNAAAFVIGGTGSNGQSLQFDTLRLFTDVSAVPAPFQPAPRFVGWGVPL